MGIFDKVKAAAGKVSDTVKGAYTGGVDVVRGMLTDISGASADLERVGFVVKDIEVCVGLPPGVTVFLAKQRDATEEEFTAAFANNANKLTVRTLLSLVQQADAWIGSLKLAGRDCKVVAVELGFRPGVRLIYSRKDLEAMKEEPAGPLPNAETPPESNTTADAQPTPKPV